MHQCKACWQYKPMIKENFKKMNSRYCNACETSGLVPVDRAPTKTGRLAVRPRANCHPDQPHVAKGLCRICYNKQYER